MIDYIWWDHLDRTDFFSVGCLFGRWGTLSFVNWQQICTKVQWSIWITDTIGSREQQRRMWVLYDEPNCISTAVSHLLIIDYNLQLFTHIQSISVLALSLLFSSFLCSLRMHASSFVSDCREMMHLQRSSAWRLWKTDIVAHLLLSQSEKQNTNSHRTREEINRFRIVNNRLTIFQFLNGKLVDSAPDSGGRICNRIHN